MSVLKKNMRDKHRKGSKYDDSDHLTLDKPINYADDDQIFICENCQFETQKVYFKWTHEKETQNIILGYLQMHKLFWFSLKSHKTKVLNTYKCGYCDRILRSDNLRKDHIREVHGYSCVQKEKKMLHI